MKPLLVDTFGNRISRFIVCLTIHNLRQMGQSLHRRSKMKNKAVKYSFVLVASMLSIIVIAQDNTNRTQSIDNGAWASFSEGLVGSVVYSILGIVVLMVGFKIFDWITPFSLNKEIEEKNNTAAGVIVAGIMIALGLIVAAAIL